MRLAVGLIHKLLGPTQNPILISDRISGKDAPPNGPSISVNPNKSDSIPILRSNNQDMGIEFTYSTWLYIEDDNFSKYKPDKIKHIFNKGSGEGSGVIASGQENAGMQGINAPGLYLDKNINKLIVLMDTYDKPGERIDIPDIPIRKWVSIVIRLENRHLDVYINGTIAIRHELSSVPKQNYGNINVHLDGGFDGEHSSLRYFNKALTSLEIQRLVQKGPNMTTSGIVSPFPPYLSTRWFFK